MKEKQFVGNYIAKIKDIIINQLNGQEIEVFSNQIDEALYVYDLSGKKVTVVLSEELIEDTTTIRAEESTLKRIIDNI